MMRRVGGYRGRRSPSCIPVAAPGELDVGDGLHEPGLVRSLPVKM